MTERLLRHLEPEWRPERTSLSPANGDKFRIGPRQRPEPARLVVTCNGSGHITIQQRTDSSPPRTEISRCGAASDTVTRIKIAPNDSVTVTPSNSTVQVLWGTR